MISKIELRRTRDFGQIISDTIVFIMQNWKSLLKTYFVFCGVFMAGHILFSILFELKIVSIHKSLYNDTGTYNRYSQFGYEYYLLLFFSFFNIIATTLTTICYAVLYKQNDNGAPTVEQVWVWFKYYFFRVIGAFILFGIMFTLAMAACIFPVFFILSPMRSVYGGIIAFFCILIPMLYLLTVFFTFYPIMIAENAGFASAFSRCFKLTKGRWWATFGVVFVVALIVYSIFLMLAVPFGMISGGSIAFLSYNVSTWVTILYSSTLGLFQVLYIMPMVASVVTYFSYVEEKESVGLMERIASLGSTQVIDDNDPINDEY